MITMQMDAAAANTEILRNETDTLKDRLARLTQANIAIADNADTEGALQEVVTSA